MRYLAVAGALLFAGAVSAQTGSIAGTVTDASTNEPMSGVQVSIPNTGLGTLTGDDGRFIIRQVPEGRQVVRVDMIGYEQYSRSVTVPADDVVNLTITLESQAIALDEIIVTGVVGATQRAKVPFEVSQLRTQDLVVPQVSAAASIQGKVAGATVVSGSGTPGSAPTILLRGPTSINSSGRNQSPLYIVDGVILGSSLADVGSLDIESIEIVKGAAAASLYGSRAANGVVQITTKRGQGMPDNEVRYTLRSEYGNSALPESPDALLTEVHQYRVDENGLFENADGTSCEWLQCDSPVLSGANEWDTYAVNEWPGETYNQVERFFENGQFMQNYLSAEGRAGATNFHISASNTVESGVLPGLDGYERTNFRLNVDQSVVEDLQVSGSAYYSRSERDTEGGGALFDLTRMPAGVDLLGPDPNDSSQLVLVVDPTNIESPNPIYTLRERENSQDRGRFLGSGNVRYSPMDWLSVDANMSYDRLDYDSEVLYPKGYRTTEPNAQMNDGNLSRSRSLNEAVNASVTASMNFELGDNVVNQTQVRYLYENEDYESVSTSGYRFAVGGVPVFDNIDSETIGSGSYLRTIRSDGYFAITNFEFMDRYVLDALVRNDGSSLFGADERRQWYYRVAGAWRMASEPWFPLDFVDEFKVRASRGTAGGRPTFTAQYETYSVSGGFVSPVNLGNRNLKPEHATEDEFGVDATFMGGRMLLGLTYAKSSVEDQIMPVPLPAYAGFGTQWRNVGTLENTSWEASLNLQLVRSRSVTWSTRAIFDKTYSEITQLDVPPFQYGVGGQGLGDVFYATEGAEYGSFYGFQFAEDCGHLPEGVACDGWEQNDEGLLVYAPNGLDENDWGTDYNVENFGDVKWGTPVAGYCQDVLDPDNETQNCPVGNSIPDFNLSFSTTLGWGGLSLYGLLDSSHGFDIYNQPLQWGTFKRYSGIMDQTDVPEAERKPVGYFDALYGVSGLEPSSIFVEDGSFWKLRELSAAYRFGAEQLTGIPGLQRFSSINLSVSGRNLMTWTDYRGYDPEVGRGGGNTGSAVVARVDGFQYPNFRTVTAALELVF
ncbi:MAG: SusC/RagA family TonB-linked outer membrane protein [Longimicrobiales bacterium]